MKLSKPDEMDDLEQTENDTSGAEEQTVAVEWNTDEIPVSDAVEGHSRMLMDVIQRAAEEDRVDELERIATEQYEMLAEQRETIEQIRSDVAALFEAVGQESEHGYAVPTGDSAWVPSSTDPYDPTGEFE